MRKILSLVMLLFSILFTLISCTEPTEKRGISNYHIANSESSLSLRLLPSDDFLEKFDYVDGDYYYISRETIISLGDEQEIMYLVYEEDIYDDAKDFVFQRLLLSKEHRYSYNGYEFIENIGQLEGRDPNVVNDRFPYWFNMVAFNDEKQTIVFLGFNMPEKLLTAEIEQLLTFEDMGAFLKKYFSFYDFDK